MLQNHGIRLTIHIWGGRENWLGPKPGNDRGHWESLQDKLGGVEHIWKLWSPWRNIFQFQILGSLTHNTCLGEKEGLSSSWWHSSSSLSYDSVSMHEALQQHGNMGHLAPIIVHQSLRLSVPRIRLVFPKSWGSTLGRMWGGQGIKL